MRGKSVTRPIRVDAAIAGSMVAIIASICWASYDRYAQRDQHDKQLLSNLRIEDEKRSELSLQLKSIDVARSHYNRLQSIGFIGELQSTTILDRVEVGLANFDGWVKSYKLDPKEPFVHPTAGPAIASSLPRHSLNQQQLSIQFATLHEINFLSVWSRLAQSLPGLATIESCDLKRKNAQNSTLGSTQSETIKEGIEATCTAYAYSIQLQTVETGPKTVAASAITSKPQLQTATPTVADRFEIQRIFYSPSQRAKLDEQNAIQLAGQPNLTAETSSRKANGYLKLPSSKHIVWIDGEAAPTAALSVAGAAVRGAVASQAIELDIGNQKIKLLPGQRVNEPELGIGNQVSIRTDKGVLR